MVCSQSYKVVIYILLFSLAAVSAFALPILTITSPSNNSFNTLINVKLNATSDKNVSSCNYTISGNVSSIDLFGDGHDGAKTITSANTVVNNYTRLQSSQGSGNTTINVNSSSIFKVGDLIMIHQTQGTGGATPGRYVMRIVTAKPANGRLTLNKQIDYAFFVNNGGRIQNASQVINIPQYRTLRINSGASITATSWENNTRIGGFVVIKVSDKFQNNGTVDVSAKGIKAMTQGNSGYFISGGSYNGLGIRSTDARAAFGGGGGGTYGTHVGSCGGGAGYLNSGTAGYNVGYGEVGNGGASYGQANLSTIFFGSAGGSAEWASGVNTRTGGNASGAIYIFANNMTLNGGILANTGIPKNQAGGSGRGGFGSGGSIYLVGNYVNIGTDRIKARGNVTIGASVCVSGTSGFGSNGRIKIDYKKLVGTNTQAFVKSNFTNYYGSENLVFRRQNNFTAKATNATANTYVQDFVTFGQGYNNVSLQCTDPTSGGATSALTSFFMFAGEYFPLSGAYNSGTYVGNVSKSFIIVKYNASGSYYKNSTINIYNQTSGEFLFKATNNASGSITRNISILKTGKYFYNVTIYNTSDSKAVLSTKNVWVFIVNITQLTKTPADINVFSLFNQNLNLTYNVSSDSSINNNTVKMYFTVNDSKGKNCLSYLNNTVVCGLQSSTDTKTKNRTLIDYQFVSDENIIYPGIYFADPDLFDESAPTWLTLSSSNAYFKLNTTNFKVRNRYKPLEIMLKNTSVTSQTVSIRYCNKTYKTGNPATSSNCNLICTISSATPKNHTHSANNYHYVCPIPINWTTQKSGTVVLTNISSVVISGGNRWQIATLQKNSYSGAVYVASSTNTWNAATNVIPNMHIHDYNGTEKFWWRVCANNSLGMKNCSAYGSDLIQLMGIAPYQVNIYRPLQDRYIQGTIPINYTISGSANAYSISNYSISLLNSSFVKVTNIRYNKASLNYSWAFTGYSGIHFIQVRVCDSQNQCSISLSSPINLSNVNYAQIYGVVNLTNPTNNSNSLVNTNIIFNLSSVQNQSLCTFNLNSTGRNIILPFNDLGDGHDGDVNISANKIVNNYTYILRNASVGNYTLIVNSVSEFKVGDIVLIIQSQSFNGGTQGRYEYAKIAGKKGTYMNLTTPLRYSYNGKTGNSKTGTITQVVNVPQYRHLSISSTKKIYAPSWNGFTGGIVAFKSQNEVNISGYINVSVSGFRAGNNRNMTSPEVGSQGESYTGLGKYLSTYNLGAGGGATATSGNAGGGAGYISRGKNGTGSASTLGRGGLRYGWANLSLLNFGSGGGLGAGAGGNANGTNGGGIIIIQAKTINISSTGRINSNSNNSAGGASRYGSGGGGSGGSIFLSADNMNLGTQLIKVQGGIPIAGSQQTGGTGSNGSIRLEYKKMSGTINSGYTTTKANITYNRTYNKYNFTSTLYNNDVNTYAQTKLNLSFGIYKTALYCSNSTDKFYSKNYTFNLVEPLNLSYNYDTYNLNSSDNFITVSYNKSGTLFVNATVNLYNGSDDTFLSKYTSTSTGKTSFNISISNTGKYIYNITAYDSNLAKSTLNSKKVWVFILNITQLTKSPADINSILLFNQRLNITYNISSDSVINNNTVKLEYIVNNSRNLLCLNYVNGTAFCGRRTNEVLIKNRSVTNYQMLMYEDQIYPGVYLVPTKLYDDNTPTWVSFATDKTNFKISFNNLRLKNRYKPLEIMLKNTSITTDVVYIKYCNSSYSTGSSLTSSNCNSVCTISTATPINHTHNSNDYHYVCSLPVNWTTGRIGTVVSTNISYIIVTGTNKWQFATLQKNLFSGAVYTSTSESTWIPQVNMTPNIFIHDFNGTETFWWRACANNTLNMKNCSVFGSDLLQLAGMFPYQSIVSRPLQDRYIIGNIGINYTASGSPNGYSIVNYTIFLSNATLGNVAKIRYNKLSLNYTWSFLNYDGSYNIGIRACDSQNQCSLSYSLPMNLTNISYSQIYGVLDLIYPINSSTYNDGSSFVLNMSSVQNISLCQFNLKAISGNMTIRTPYGDKRDGNINITSSNVIINNYTTVTDSELLADTNIINVASTTQFRVGDEIMILQSQSNSTQAGRYEFLKILSKSSTQINTTSNLKYTYHSNYFNRTIPDANNTQIIRVPNYNNFSISSGASVKAKAWDGSSGGVLIYRSLNSYIKGVINVTGRGYRGGFGTSDPSASSKKGESWAGLGFGDGEFTGTTGGGGAGWRTADNTPGGGAGYGTQGSNGVRVSPSAEDEGLGGDTYGVSNLSLIFMGAGGGNGAKICTYRSKWGESGNGGGIILIYSDNFNSSSYIQSNGYNNLSISDGFSRTGGGAGGSIRIVSNILDIDTNMMSVSGASGISYTGASLGSRTYTSGSGGIGRIRLEYNTLKGSTVQTPSKANVSIDAYTNFTYSKYNLSANVFNNNSETFSQKTFNFSSGNYSTSMQCSNVTDIFQTKDYLFYISENGEVIYITFNISRPKIGCSYNFGCKTPGCVACEYPFFNNTKYINYNVTPFGQNSSLAFYRITNNGTVDINLSISLNQSSYPGVKFKVSSNKTGLQHVCTGSDIPVNDCIYIQNTTKKQIFMDLITGYSADIWLWTDFVGVPGGTSVNRNITFNATIYTSEPHAHLH